MSHAALSKSLLDMEAAHCHRPSLSLVTGPLYLFHFCCCCLLIESVRMNMCSRFPSGATWVQGGWMNTPNMSTAQVGQQATLTDRCLETVTYIRTLPVRWAQWRRCFGCGLWGDGRCQNSYWDKQTNIHALVKGQYDITSSLPPSPKHTHRTPIILMEIDFFKEVTTRFLFFLVTGNLQDSCALWPWRFAGNAHLCLHVFSRLAG